MKQLEPSCRKLVPITQAAFEFGQEQQKRTEETLAKRKAAEKKAAAAKKAAAPTPQK